MKISIIAAVSTNNVIGGGFQSISYGMPWHLPEDLRHFKALTLNKTVIMGRKTYESIGRPLPQRNNIIISRQKINFIGCLGAKSLAVAVSLAAKHQHQEVFIVGGGQIYQQALPLATRLYLTEIHKEYHDGNLIYFPQWDKKQWREISRKKSQDGELSYDFVVYEQLSNSN